MTLRLKGDDVARAVRTWMTNEIEKAPSFGHDMGKHFFSTSAATIGVIATLAKFDENVPSIPLHLGLAVVLLLAAASVGLLLSLPFPKPIGEDTDLFVEYAKAIRRLVVFSTVWLLLWLTGTVWGMIVVL